MRSNANRRRSIRLRLDSGAVVIGDQRGPRQDCTVVDLCDVGCQCRVPLNVADQSADMWKGFLYTGHVISVTLCLPGQFGRLGIKAEVRWCYRKSPQDLLLGLHFLGLKPAQRKTLQEALIAVALDRLRGKVSMPTQSVSRSAAASSSLLWAVESGVPTEAGAPAARLDELPPGSNIGHFELAGLLGRNAWCVIYRGHALGSAEGVTIQLLAPGLARDPQVRQAFIREGQGLLRVSHPAVVPALYAGSHQGIPYVVFQGVEGRLLAALIEKQPLPEAHCLWIMRQIAQGLRRLHENGVVYRELNPQNILLDTQGNAKLVFPILNRTQAAEAGSNPYLAPELAAELSGVPDEPVSGGADLYALGGTRATPLPAGLPGKAAEKGGYFPKSKALFTGDNIPAINADLAAIVSRLLEKQVHFRFQKSEELLMALRFVNVAALPPLFPE